MPLRGIHLYEYRWLMIFDAARSLLCSVAMVLTCWLFLPILVLLPLALFFGFRFYRKVVARFRGSRILARVAGTVPMALALATLWMITELLSEGYRA